MTQRKRYDAAFAFNRALEINLMSFICFAFGARGLRGKIKPYLGIMHDSLPGSFHMRARKSGSAYDYVRTGSSCT